MQGSRLLDDGSGRKPVQISRFELRQGAQAGPRIPDQSPQEAPFRLFDLAQRCDLPGHHIGADLPIYGRFSYFRPDNLFRYPRFVRQPVSKLVTRRRVGDPRGYGEHPVEKLPPAVVPRHVELTRRPFEQVFQIGPRVPQSLQIRGPTLLPDEVVRILPGRQHRHVDLEPFGDQQLRACGLPHPVLRHRDRN